MFAAIATAAQPGTAPSNAAQASGFVETILGVTVNRQQEDEPIIALRDSAGRVFINAADLTRWRLRLPDIAPTIFQGERYYPLAAFAGLVATVDEQAQTLAIEAPPGFFGATELDAVAARVPAPERSAVGGFLNYALLATREESGTTGTG
jgi:outer membrane usher protein